MDRDSDSTVNRVVDLIQQQFREPITVRDLAAAVERQPGHLTKLFTRRFGISVRRYLTLVRLEHARALLYEGASPQTAGLMIGARNPAKFCAQLRDYLATL